MNVNSKISHIIIFFIIFIVSVIYLISFQNGHNWGDDFAAYIDQARSLVEGDYNKLLIVNKFRYDNSTQKGIGPVFYPWGFPLLLTPIYYVFGLDIYIMKIYVNIFFLLSLITIFFLFKTTLGNFQCLLLISIIGFNKWFFDLKENVLSDIPFMFFTLLSLFLIKKIIIERKVWLNRYASYFLIGLLISVSFNIRTIGIVLLPTLLFTQYIEKRSLSKGNGKRILNIPDIIPYTVFLLFNIIIIFLLPRGGGSYLQDLSLIKTQTLIKNIIYYIALPARFFPFLNLKVSYSYYTFSKFSLIFYTVVILFVFWGVIVRLRKDYLYVFFSLLNLSVLICWPHRQGLRFILPLLPFFLYFLFIGLSRTEILINLSEKIKILRINASIVFGSGLLVISLVYFLHAIYVNILNKENHFIIEGPYSPESIELFEYIKANTKEDDAIVFFKPKALHLYTGRKSLVISRYNFTIDMLQKLPADYIVFNKKRYISSEPVIDDFTNRVDCIFENERFIFCRLKK